MQGYLIGAFLEGLNGIYNFVSVIILNEKLNITPNFNNCVYSLVLLLLNSFSSNYQILVVTRGIALLLVACEHKMP